jgi:hypothetical protein
MGNNPSKERHQSSSQYAQPAASSSQQPSTQPSSASADRRPNRHEISLFGINPRNEVDPSAPEARKETKAEREVRKLEKERALREKEREKSLKEESIDGGYLVTLGVYTGPEDFSKPTVRKLQVCHMFCAKDNILTR